MNFSLFSLSKISSNIFSRRIFSRIFPSVNSTTNISSLISSQFRLFSSSSLSSLSSAEISRLRSSADSGDVSSNFSLGLLYYEGKNSLIAQNYRLALLHFTAAAASNDSASLRYLGLIYFAGYGIPRDPTLAREMFQKSADLGDIEANYLIGNIFRFGAASAARSIERAIFHFRRSAAAGHSKSNFSLAQIFLSGEGGTTINLEESTKFAIAAAESNHPEGAFLASKLLEKRFSDGRGSPGDLERSKNFIRNSAELRFRPAQLALGLELLNSGDFVESEYWLGAAADQGCVIAQERLGFHLIGKNEPIGSDIHRKALQFLSNSAESGAPAPQFQLAILAMKTDHPKKSQTAQAYIEKSTEFIEKNSSKFPVGVGVTMLKLRVRPELIPILMEKYEKKIGKFWNGEFPEAIAWIHENFYQAENEKSDSEKNKSTEKE